MAFAIVKKSNKNKKPSLARRKKQDYEFYIHLTSWEGKKFKILYQFGKPLPLEASPSGGTYISCGNRLFFVRETVDSIHHQINTAC